MSGYQLTIEDHLATLAKRTDDEDDTPRLNDQCLRTYRALRDLLPHTLREISTMTGDPEGSISARIREIRMYLEDRKPGQLTPGPFARGTIIRQKVKGARGLHNYSMRLKKYSGAA